MKLSVKLCVIVVAVVLSLAVFGVLGWFAWGSYSVASLWKSASAKIESGDHDGAMHDLKEVLKRDRSNEKACRMLADLCEKRDDFVTGAYYWNQVAMLNPLDPDAADMRIQMLLDGQKYAAAAQLLRAKYKENKLSPRQISMFAYAVAASGTLDEAAELLAEAERIDAGDPRLMRIRAVLLLRRGDVKNAALAYGRMLRSDDRNARWLGMMGMAQIAGFSGKWSEAEQWLLKAVAVSPRRTYMALGELYKLRGKLDESRKYFELELASQPDNRAAVINLGELFAAQKKADEIRKLRSGLSVKSKTDLEVAYYLDTLAFYVDNKLIEAANAIELCPAFHSRQLCRVIHISCYAALGKTALIREEVNALLKLAPGPGARAQLAEQLARLLPIIPAGRPDDVEGVTRLIFELGAPDSPAYRRAETRMMLDSYNRRDFDTVIRLAEKRLKADPKDETSRLMLAEAQFSTGKVDRSLANFQQVKASLPARIGEALCFEALRKYDSANKIYQDAMAKSPGDTMLLERFAMFLLRTRHLKELNELLDAFPTDTPRRKYAVNSLRAYMFEQSGLSEKQRESRLEAIDSLTKMPSAQERDYQLACLYAQTDQDEKAEEIYDRLLKTNPNWGLVLVNLSEVKAALGKATEAMSLARKAQTLYPSWEPAKSCLRNRLTEAEKSGR
ncbi:MAG: tetratricopeptide repeat protein [Victivallaceae bacterium]|nr:tetratricopeptide repeat protein [Victivallaceae bacterium]